MVSLNHIATLFTCSPVPQSEMDIDVHIYTSASESGYEPVGQDTHTNETEENDMLDNMAYGKVDDQSEATQDQYEAVVELKGNESYNSVPQTPEPDEGEYSYATKPPDNIYS